MGGWHGKLSNWDWSIGQRVVHTLHQTSRRLKDLHWSAPAVVVRETFLEMIARKPSDHFAPKDLRAAVLWNLADFPRARKAVEEPDGRLLADTLPAIPAQYQEFVNQVMIVDRGIDVAAARDPREASPLIIDLDQVNQPIVRPWIQKFVAREQAVSADVAVSHLAEIIRIQFVEMTQQRSMGRLSGQESDLHGHPRAIK